MRTNNMIKGYSMIELMIVVAIIGILAGIAYPLYMSSVLKAGRADAKVELNDVSLRLQRCFTSTQTYDAASGACAVVDELKGPGVTSKEGNYLITAPTLEARAFRLVADPTAGSRQLQDAKCTQFALTNTGERSASGSNPDECW